MSDEDRLRSELAALEGSAANFATTFFVEADVRRLYQRLARELSAEIMARYRAGEISARTGAEIAQQMRNELLEMCRARSTPTGNALARLQKPEGKALEELLDYYAAKRHGGPFAGLTQAQRTDVYEEVIRAAGRPNPRVSRLAARLGVLSRTLWLLSIGVAVYDISVADDKLKTAVHDAAILVSGGVGGWATGAAAGAVFGPIGAIIGSMVGGVLFAVFADIAFSAETVPMPAPEEVPVFNWGY